jgi:hypothetical protein
MAAFSFALQIAQSTEESNLLDFRKMISGTNSLSNHNINFSFIRDPTIDNAEDYNFNFPLQNSSVSEIVEASTLLLEALKMRDKYELTNVYSRSNSFSSSPPTSPLDSPVERISHSSSSESEPLQNHGTMLSDVCKKDTLQNLTFLSSAKDRL